MTTTLKLYPGIRDSGMPGLWKVLQKTALIAEYQTQLPDQQLLAAKLHEFYVLNAPRPGIAKTARKATTKPVNKPPERANKRDRS